jgi:hypothetical protein
MNCDRTTELLSDRFKGLLSAEQKELLEAHLETCGACREEADAVSALWTEMDVFDDDVPHERMRARFHAALTAYEEPTGRTRLDRLIERIWPSRPAFQAGTAVALLFAGLVLGRGLPSSTDREIANLRNDIRSLSLALLDHQSASARLRGVEWSRRAASNAHAIDALLETVREDRNINVRLAAVEALSEWLDRPEVGAALTSALSRQDSPLMQLTLAKVLLERNVDGSLAAVERLLDRERLDPSVRDYLSAVLRETNGASGANRL